MRTSKKKTVFTNIVIWFTYLWWFIANHCMRFARARLAIREHCAIISKQNFGDERSDDCLINVGLLWFGSKCSIECESFRHPMFNRLPNDNFTSRLHLDHFVRMDSSLASIDWSVLNVSTHKKNLLRIISIEWGKRIYRESRYILRYHRQFNENKNTQHLSYLHRT